MFGFHPVLLQMLSVAGIPRHHGPVLDYYSGEPGLFLEEISGEPGLFLEENLGGCLPNAALHAHGKQQVTLPRDSPGFTMEDQERQ